MREITVLDVIARECGADFTATLAEYVRLCPEGARLAAGAAEDEILQQAELPPLTKGVFY